MLIPSAVAVAGQCIQEEERTEQWGPWTVQDSTVASDEPPGAASLSPACHVWIIPVSIKKASLLWNFHSDNNTSKIIYLDQQHTIPLIYEAVSRNKLTQPADRRDAMILFNINAPHGAVHEELGCTPHSMTCAICASHLDSSMDQVLFIWSIPVSFLLFLLPFSPSSFFLFSPLFTTSFLCKKKGPPKFYIDRLHFFLWAVVAKPLLIMTKPRHTIQAYTHRMTMHPSATSPTSHKQQGTPNK